MDARIIKIIDIGNHWVGRFACLLLIPVIFAMVFEVIARKLFVSPTMRAYDTSRMFAGALFMLGADYALMKGVHIRADFLYRKWSVKTQSTVDAILYMAFYFPAMVFFFWISSEYTFKAWTVWELSMDSAFMAPLAPARTAMPLGAFFLFMQGISEFLKCVHFMSRERARLFLISIPFYVILLGLVFLSTYSDELPLGGMWSDFVSASGLSDIPPEWIGVIMIAIMLFSIFVGFPIS